MAWYTSNTSAGQALVIDEATGANIAVCYDIAHGPLVAEVPAMVEALRDLVKGNYGQPWAVTVHALDPARAILARIDSQ